MNWILRPGFLPSKSAMWSLVNSLFLYITVKVTVAPLDDVEGDAPASQAARAAPDATSAVPVRKPRRLMAALLNRLGMTLLIPDGGLTCHLIEATRDWRRARAHRGSRRVRKNQPFDREPTYLRRRCRPPAQVSRKPHRARGDRIIRQRLIQR